MRSPGESFTLPEGPRAVARPIPLDEYSGYIPPAGKISPIDEVSNSISPEQFFEKYISKRKPALIKGHLIGDGWKGDLWTNEYLMTNGHDARVIVERRGVGQSFGLAAPKVDMRYGEFVKHLQAGDDRLYLTTQDLERFAEDLDSFDMPKSVSAEPLKSLASDYPVRPKLLGNLVPYQISMWQGLAKEGTSSGLHHDYHDNLYILIRGRKRFRLFPPSAAPCMQTEGTLAKIHKNGLVVYRSSPRDQSVSVRADGVPYIFLARMKREYAEAELTEAEEELKDLMENDGRGLSEDDREAECERLRGVIAECEDRMEMAMNDMLDDVDDDSDADSLCGINADPATSPCKRTSLDDCPEPKAKRCRTESDGEQNCFTPMPDHFCHVKFPTHTDKPEELFSDYPAMKELGCIICEVAAGDMLYLPASWFHEVTSFSSPGPTDPSDSSRDSGHLAFNYWMFPPDNDRYDLPYWDDFWERRWAGLQEEKEQGDYKGNGDSHLLSGDHYLLSEDHHLLSLDPHLSSVGHHLVSRDHHLLSGDHHLHPGDHHLLTGDHPHDSGDHHKLSKDSCDVTPYVHESNTKVSST